jgi:hypothetical protein
VADADEPLSEEFVSDSVMAVFSMLLFGLFRRGGQLQLQLLRRRFDSDSGDSEDGAALQAETNRILARTKSGTSTATHRRVNWVNKAAGMSRRHRRRAELVGKEQSLGEKTRSNNDELTRFGERRTRLDAGAHEKSNTDTVSGQDGENE